MDNLIPVDIKRWAAPREFDIAKQIKIKNFEKLTLAQITEREGKSPKYPPFDGYVRRLTFEEQGFIGERTLDINSPKFQVDLSKYNIKKDDIGMLQRTKKEEDKGFTWTWLKT